MNNEVDKKIEALFQSRQIDEMIERTGASPAFQGQLIRLQEKIYELDVLLESQWLIPEELLRRKWENIETELKSFGVEENEFHDYLLEIGQYESQELNLRKGILPFNISFRDFYYYKSCDVRLIRRLILEQYNVQNAGGEIKQWLPFDLITEVIDDLEDLEEDQNTFSLNLILLYLASGKREECLTELSHLLIDIRGDLLNWNSWQSNNIGKRILESSINKLYLAEEKLNGKLHMVEDQLPEHKIPILSQLKRRDMLLV